MSNKYKLISDIAQSFGGQCKFLKHQFKGCCTFDIKNIAQIDTISETENLLLLWSMYCK